MSSEGYSLESYVVTLEKRATDPSTQVGRIYYNTVDKRPKVCIEDP